MSENNIESNNQSFKVIIIVLTITLLGSLFYIYKISDRTKGIIMSLREEKAEVLKDLEKSKLFLDQALNNESSVNSQLILEQEKVKKLIDEIKKEGVNKTEIVQIKKGADNVNERINALVKELNFYKKKADSTTVILGKQKVLNDTLVNSNKILSKKITTASKLYYYGLQVVAYKLRSSGEKVATEKARKTDLLKISFAIAENDLVKAFNNTLYVQIIDSNNNVIGEKKTENFGNDILIYSYTANVKYKNKTIKIEQELPIEYIEKGPYFINVFDKSNLVLHTSITLL
jgi:predicted Holliday junction resolvase-like endonuclease